MTFLNFKLDFFKKVEYILLYLNTIIVFLLCYNLITINLLNLHSEKIFFYNYCKKKKIFLFIFYFINKKMCKNCNIFFYNIRNIKIKNNNIKNFFFYKRKKIFFLGC